MECYMAMRNEQTIYKHQHGRISINAKFKNGLNPSVLLEVRVELTCNGY